MSIGAYKQGQRAGLTGLPHLAHRNGRRYDSNNANISYSNGYTDGCRLRRDRQNSVQPSKANDETGTPSK